MKALRRLVNGVTLTLGELKRNRRISIPDGGSPVKVNLGCGLAVARGWINMDGSLNALVAGMPRFMQKLAYRNAGASDYYTEAEYCRLLSEHRFVHHDLSFSVPLADGVADFVYSSHFVEHLFRQDAQHLLEEIHRVLKPGGYVRIAIPDLEYALSLYQAGKKDKMLSDYFFVDGKDSYYARHKYMYDYELISQALQRAGFRDIQRRKFREGRVPDVEVLDKYPDESLFVEAVR